METWGGRILGLVCVSGFVVALLLASDHAHWRLYSFTAMATAIAVAVLWRWRQSEVLEAACALTWLFALVVSARWLAMPAVFGPIIVIALVGAPFVVANERRMWLRGQRQNERACPECGYDLRASSDRCPECGHAIDEDRQRRERVAAALRQRRAQRASGGRPPPPPPDQADGPIGHA